MLNISSIKKFLLIAIISLISLVWGISAALNFHESQEQVEELFDAELAQMGRILQTVIAASLKQDSQTVTPRLNYLDEQLLSKVFGHEEYDDFGHKYEKKLAFQMWNSQGELFFENHSSLPQEFSLVQRGYQTLLQNDLNWRSFTLQDEALGFWIRVAQREDVRTELTNEIAWNTTWPTLVIVPFLIIVLGWIIQRGLEPLRTISSELKGRSYQNLSQLNKADYPLELKRMVAELNNLFLRVSEASERERRFTADAAHELRTPLAIAKVHLQNVKQISDSAQITDFVDKALLGIERLIHMVKQLLILSRLDAGQDAEVSKDICVNDVCNELIHEVCQNLGFDASCAKLQSHEECTWHTNETLLRILIRNLLDNACRYASVNTLVECILSKEKMVIQNVCPRMSEDALAHILERFKRGKTNQQGSGLGLSICQQICKQNAYQLTIANRKGETVGIEVTINITADQ